MIFEKLLHLKAAPSKFSIRYTVLFKINGPTKLGVSTNISTVFHTTHVN